jgi:ABC-2 type transport system permease protein
MTITAERPLVPTVAPTHPTGGRLRERWHNVVVLTRRNLVHVARDPMQLSDVTIQPVLFTLLFIYVFGAGIPIPGGSYVDFALAGLLTLNLTTSTVGTAVGICSDLTTGVIDRFRTLPMWKAAILIGRSISDVLAATVCVAIVAVTGLAIGWRPTTGVLSVLGGFGIALLFSYALSWASACMGLISKGAESAQSLGFIVVFPLAFVSNAMVPTVHMPTWLQYVADWNPVSAVTSACRVMFGNPNPSSAIHVWPMQHPVEAALIWCGVFLVVFAPLAVHLFRTRTAE